MAESLRGAKNFDEHKDYIKKKILELDSMMAARQTNLDFRQLRTYASPCFLQNIRTEPRTYTFYMEGPQGKNPVEYTVSRTWVDNVKNPSMVAADIVKAMRIVCLRQLPFKVEDIVPVVSLVHPYEVGIERIYQGNYRMTMTAPDVTGIVGYFNGITDMPGVAQTLKIALDSKKNQIAAEQKLIPLDDMTQEKKVAPVAQLTKKKPPQCPEHGNFLEPSDIEGELHCPIGGCETKARKKGDGSKVVFETTEPLKVEIKKPPIDLSLLDLESDIYNSRISVARDAISHNAPIVTKEENGRVLLMQLDYLTMQPIAVMDVTHLLGRPPVRHNIQGPPINVTSMNSSHPVYVPGSPREQYLEMELRVKLAP